MSYTLWEVVKCQKNDVILSSTTASGSLSTQITPLFVHRNGQWAKKVRGKLYYFGRLSEPDEALTLWLDEKDYLLAGLEPPTYTGGFTVGELCDEHMTNMKNRMKAGNISLSTVKDYQAVRNFLEEAELLNISIDVLGPIHFKNARQWLSESDYRPKSQKNIIISTKAIFNWGKKMGLCERDINYGPEFVPPDLTAIETEQEENGVVRFFDRDFILKILDASDARMKVAVLLGINCAFYPGDTAFVTYKHLHLDAPIPYHDFRRVKTRHKRMAALWPETVAAIQDYTENYRPQSDYSEVFLSQQGKPYTKEAGCLSFIGAFNRLLEKVGDRPKGVSIGSLRHTYGTVMDLVNDTQMVDLTMGHVAGTVRGRAGKSLQRRIYSQFNINELKRLKAVADVVHDWLFDGKYCEPEL